MAEIKLTRWDLVDHWESDEDIISYLQVVLEDGLAEMIAATLVDIARAKGLFAASDPKSHGESYLEKAIQHSYRRNLDGLPKVWTLNPTVPESAD